MFFQVFFETISKRNSLTTDVALVHRPLVPRSLPEVLGRNGYGLLSGSPFCSYVCNSLAIRSKEGKPQQKRNRNRQDLKDRDSQRRYDCLSENTRKDEDSHREEKLEVQGEIVRVIILKMDLVFLPQSRSRNSALPR